MRSTARSVGLRCSLLGLTAGAVLSSGTGPAAARSFAGISKPSAVREIGFAVRGKVEQLLVVQGDQVESGSVLMRLDDTVQQRTLDLARVRAEDDSEVRLAETRAAYEEKELEFTIQSHNSSGASDKELRQANFRRDSTVLGVETARRQATEFELSLAREQARLKEMQLKSPIDGTVLEIHRHPGETVDELTPVLTVVRIDPLWLDVSVPMRQALKLIPGQRAEVIWQDVDDIEPMAGRVIFRSPAGDAGARELLVRVEVANPSGLPSGLHGDVRFLDD